MNYFTNAVETATQKLQQMIDERIDRLLGDVAFDPSEWHRVVQRCGEMDKTLIFFRGNCVAAFESTRHISGNFDDIVFEFSWWEVPPPDARWDGHQVVFGDADS